MKDDNKEVVVRFAPSPTGFFHIGSARTALFNELFARQKNGKMILRIEDTDESRNKKEYEDSIIEGLAWLGISYDEFYRQSERKELYEKKLHELVEKGNAYISKEETGASKEVIRFRNPGTEIIFQDLIRGEIKMKTNDLGDFVIAKDFRSPLYHFAVSVDDAEMGVTHVIRGEDGISNTPRQILIQEALGATRPTYAHIPLILAPDRSKLSKRHGAVSVLEYKELGYLPEAIINFLAMLGWNPGTEQELFSKAELIKNFDLSAVQKSGAIFNQDKLNWFNREYLKRIPEKELQIEMQSILSSDFGQTEGFESKIKRLTPTLLERISVLSDLGKMKTEGELDYFFTTPEYDAEMLVNPKDRKKAGDDITSLMAQTKNNIDNIIHLLQTKLSEENEQISADDVKESVWDFALKEGKGAVLWPMRFALSGKEKSPDPFTLAHILGIKESTFRLNLASQKLQQKL